MCSLHSAQNYGNWTSPITPEIITQGQVSLDEVQVFDGHCYVIERRPRDKGRCVIVSIRYSDHQCTDILAEPYSARSRVHEYGGGSYHVCASGIFFVNDQDQDIYLVSEGETRRITDQPAYRFADFVYDARHQRLIAVCEIHADEVRNSLVSIDISNGMITTLVEGDDFYASPRLNGNSTAMSWQSWNHPNMPWDGNCLYKAEICTSGDLASVQLIAGDTETSIFQPRWTENRLYYISDSTGWWQLYVHDPATGSNQQLTTGEREFGLPQWVFAQSSYYAVNDETIYCSYQQNGENLLGLLDINSKSLKPLATDWNMFSQLTGDANGLAFIAASGNTFPQLVLASAVPEQAPEKLSLDTHVARESCSLDIDAGYYSQARTLTFSNRHGQSVYANYYPPRNPDYTLATSADQLPPMIVICHGGPTGQSQTALDPKKQFWTSRGFALLDVNYSGSTGYGRAYRERLNGRWGILDVEDCCDAADYAVQQGLANADQLIIRGSSAGGLTVLAALTFHTTFKAGASYYGVAELSSLATDSHKFELRYLDRLIGPYPELAEEYQNRSPLQHVERLNCPVIFFHGEQDRLVPVLQARQMLAALRQKGIMVAIQTYADEQHGFRQAQTIIDSLQNELAFYQRVFRLIPESEIHFSGDLQLYNA